MFNKKEDLVRQSSEPLELAMNVLPITMYRFITRETNKLLFFHLFRQSFLPIS